MSPYEFVKEHYQLPVELYEFQQEAVNKLAPLPQAGYYLDVGCVDCETEFLTPQGWVRFDQYDGRSRVAQYNLDGTIEFVTPTAYVKKPCDEMLHLKTGYGIDQMLSYEHRVLYKSHVSDNQYVISAAKLADKHWGSPQGFRGKFITTFTPKGMPGYSLTDAELRVQVAVIADGYFPSPSSNRVIINIKKDRKKERLVQLLAEAGIDFTAHDRDTSPGYTYYTFYAPERTKVFDEHFYECNLRQLRLIADESLLWDGTTIHCKSFSTTVKQSADFIQYAFAATGRQATLNTLCRDERKGKGPLVEYTVHIYKDSPFSCINASPKTAYRNVNAVPSTDGFKYCFMVPSTFLILRRNGRIFATGNTGKTLTSTVACLWKLHNGHVDHVICLMPPILLTNWSRNLAKIPGLTHTVYRGTPAKRTKLNLNTNFILMSYQIFKKDWQKLHEHYLERSTAVICDEAQAIKNVGSATHKMVRDFALSNHLLLLTGTPLSSPIDGYAYIKLVAPLIYRNLLQFENIHVAKRDFFDKPTEWDNLDLLRENLKVNSVRVLKEDVLKDLPPVTYTEIFYDLNDDHLKLYRELAEKQLKVLEDGTKVDLTNASSLFNALQQVPCNAEHFSGGTMMSTALELLDEVMDELGDKKLVVFTKYIMTNRRLQEHGKKYDVRVLFGDTSAKQKQDNLDHFISDPACRLLVLQLQSGSAGIDGLHTVCSDVLFLELPHTAAAFTQASARIHRNGQMSNVNVRVALAEKTLQPYIWDAVQERDSLVNLCIRGPQDIRDAINGIVSSCKH